jgi:hypothetical protein
MYSQKGSPSYWLVFQEKCQYSICRFRARDVTAFQSEGFAQSPKPNPQQVYSSSVLYLILRVEVMILQWKIGI